MLGCGGAASGAGTVATAAHERNDAMEEEDRLQRLLAACHAAGDACLAHCLRLIGQGDTSMADCARSVVIMLPVCEAAVTLAENDSSHLSSMLSICADVCTECMDSCRPHASHHDACARCLQACQEVVSHVRALG